MKTYNFYPDGIGFKRVLGGRGHYITCKPQYCYGDGFKRYMIDDRFHWFYDEECVYHIEDSKTHKIVFIGIGGCPKDIIDEFIRQNDLDIIYER